MEGQPCGSGVNLCGGRNVEGHTHKLLSAYWRVAVVLDSIESVKQVVRDDLRVTIHFSPMRAVCSDFGRTPNIADGPLLGSVIRLLWTVNQTCSYTSRHTAPPPVVTTGKRIGIQAYYSDTNLMTAWFTSCFVDHFRNQQHASDFRRLAHR